MKRCWAVVVAAGVVLAAVVVSSGSLAGTDLPGLAARVAASRAVEEVRWAHRTWPTANPGPKPGLDEVVSGDVFRARVLEALAMSLALERYWGRPLEPSCLQAELDRMARETYAPERLRELFAAVGHDPVLAAEVIARSILAERLLRSWYAGNPPADAAVEDGEPVSFDAWWSRVRPELVAEIERDPSLVPACSAGDVSLPSLPEPGPSRAVDEEGSWSRIPAGVPDPISGAAAVWTGTEMLVWGGGGGEGVTNAGWRYDPATDTWRALSADDVPLPRSGHCAVWTGKEMLVWGGQRSGIEYLGDGARYHPGADAWKPLPDDGAPSPRTDAVCAWTGAELLVWGGRGDGGNRGDGALHDPETGIWRPMSEDGAPAPGTSYAHAWTGSELFVWKGGAPYLYDPVADRWRRGTGDGAPESRSNAKAAWTGSCVAVWGGGYDDDHVRGDGGCYDPIADRWTELPEEGAPSPRRDHGMTWAGDRLIVWGGVGEGGVVLGDGAAWVPGEDHWTPLPAERAPAPRYDHVLLWTGREVVAWGGDDKRWNGQALYTGGRYDPDADRWVPTRATWEGPGPRYKYPGVWTGEEFVVWGGRRGNEVLGDGAAWDPATASWRHLPAGGYCPTPRWHHQAVWTGREVIYWGGTSSITANAEYPLGDGARWNPVTGRWEPMAARGAPSPRLFHTLVWTGREAIVWGGGDFAESFGSGARYDPRTDTWSPVAACPWWPRGIQSHEAVWTGHGMFVWGGKWQDPRTGDYGYYVDGGLYDPRTNTWAPVSSEGAPEERVDHGMAWTGTEAVVWGGVNDRHYLGTGAAYDPKTDRWRPTSMDGAPPPRDFHVLAWTGRRVLVWGGYDPDVLGPVRSGGSWDPETDTWESLPSRGAPRAAERSGWAWTGSELIVWGGRPSTADGGTLQVPCGEFAWYRDADGDGHGDPADRVDACSAPEGYVVFGDDCDDTDPLQYPGRPEACNGIDDDCDGTVDGDVLPPPGWVDLRVVREGSDGARLSWAPLAGADAYDADRGDLATLLASGSLFDSVDGCLANDTPSTETSDPDPVDPGAGRWYLVRGLNCGGPGTFNVGGPRQATDRDGQLLNAPGACP